MQLKFEDYTKLQQRIDKFEYETRKYAYAKVTENQLLRKQLNQCKSEIRYYRRLLLSKESKG